MTPTILWVLISVVVVVGIGVGIGKFIAVGKSRKALPARDERVHTVALACRTNGHAYVAFDTGWRCATCGNHVPRRDGELYGPVEEGRHERRREPR